MPAFLAKPIAWIIGALVILILVLALLGSLHSCSTAKTQAKLNANQADAAIASGSDAANTTGDVASRQADEDALTGENDHAIRTAPGADAPVDPAARDAALASLCRRAAYRGDPKCVRFTPAR